MNKQELSSYLKCVSNIKMGDRVWIYFEPCGISFSPGHQGLCCAWPSTVKTNTLEECDVVGFDYYQTANGSMMLPKLSTIRERNHAYRCYERLAAPSKLRVARILKKQ